MRLGHPPDAQGVAARAQFMTAPKAEKFARKNPDNYGLVLEGAPDMWSSGRVAPLQPGDRGSIPSRVRPKT